MKPVGGNVLFIQISCRDRSVYSNAFVFPLAIKCWVRISLLSDWWRQHLNGVSSLILCLPELFHRRLCVNKPLLFFFSCLEYPFLPEPCPFSIWVQYLSCIVRWWKVSIFRESILPVQLLVAVILLAL
ncbi:hypothetical protein FOWG_17137 [Fusarium oxysporum f. sp. lycopersici MN25]|nr:hypothetical protein FOWG_17137 [Fusarium oxysporum f. sp. lycopersici MN25]EWZ78632.1 hypothetical protein FOWG_17137 [Fusarium oxysporum f. sp. lycopersici MN25]EWZ78633.1 hypothetical protein FOWG_17137 [Fusarium oxysporum f. sp. lycopersici MN25]